MHDTHDVRKSMELDKKEFEIRKAHDKEMLIDEPKSVYTKGNYWRYYQGFPIYARSQEEFNEKYERMKAIADEKEYEEE